MSETGGPNLEAEVDISMIEKIWKELKRYNNLHVSMKDSNHLNLSTFEGMIKLYDNKDDEKSKKEMAKWRSVVDEYTAISRDIISVRDQIFGEGETAEMQEYYDNYFGKDDSYISELTPEQKDWLIKYYDKMSRAYQILREEPYEYSDSQLDAVARPKDSAEQVDNSGENE